MCYKIVPYKLAYLLISGSAKSFYFHILREIINGHDNELSMSLSWWEWTKEIHYPFVERQDDLYGSKVVGWLPGYLGEELTFKTTTYQFIGTIPKRGPAISTSQDFAYNHSSTLMNSTPSLMYFTKDSFFESHMF